MQRCKQAGRKANVPEAMLQAGQKESQPPPNNAHLDAVEHLERSTRAAALLTQ
jgi:hypothetical protein